MPFDPLPYLSTLTQTHTPLAMLAAGVLVYFAVVERWVLRGITLAVKNLLPKQSKRTVKPLIRYELWLVRLLLIILAVDLTFANTSPHFENFLNSLLVLVLFAGILKTIPPLLGGMLKKDIPPAVGYFIKRGVTALLIFALVTVLLDLWGVNVTALIGGLGVAGIAVALAAKDTIENVFGGMTVLGSKLFRIGDWVRVGAVEGTVEFIGLRVTHIRGFDNALRFVPNSKIVTGEIQNFSTMRRRRVKLKIGLVYDTPAKAMVQIQQRIKDYLIQDKAVDNKMACMVDYSDYGDSAIILDLYYFTVETKWAKWRDIRSRHIIEFKKIVAEEGSDFAFPTRTVWLKKGEEE